MTEPPIITGYINPDGSGEGNWTGEFATCPVCDEVIYNSGIAWRGHIAVSHAASQERPALQRIADEGWERSRKPGDDAAVLAEMAETALASQERPQPRWKVNGHTEGCDCVNCVDHWLFDQRPSQERPPIDVDRLARALAESEWAERTSMPASMWGYRGWAERILARLSRSVASGEPSE